jgi:hypothetical protein
MRKTFLALVVATLLGGTAHAELMDVSVHAGYSTVSMGQLNRSNAALWGWDTSGYWGDLNSALVTGVDLTTHRFSPWSALAWGLRAEYLLTNQAVVYMPGDNRYSDQGSLSSVLLGAKASAPFVIDGLTAGLGAWVGYGIAVMDQHVDAVSPQAPNGALLSGGSYKGGLLVGELEGSLSYPLSKRVSLSLSGGWRWADAGALKDGNGTPLYDDLQLWQFGRKMPVDIDFSGAISRASVSFSF